MKKIIITSESMMTAEGKATNANRKPVYNITTGDVYTGVMDAAEKLGVHFTAVSSACLGKSKTCKGYRLCFVADMPRHYEEIAKRTREMHPDWLAAEEQRAEERRLEEEHKLEQKRQAEEQKRIEKAKANYAKWIAKHNKTLSGLEEARAELFALGVTTM